MPSLSYVLDVCRGSFSALHSLPDPAARGPTSALHQTLQLREYSLFLKERGREENNRFQNLLDLPDRELEFRERTGNRALFDFLLLKSVASCGCFTV